MNDALVPVVKEERMQSLDILRGFALLGILLVNLQSSFRVLLYDYAMRFHTHGGMVNKAIDYLLEVLVMGKAITLLSFLFGVGMAMQVDRAEKRHRSHTGLLARRMGALLAIGVLHYFLLWDGDILILYSLCGFFLLALQRLSAGTLLRLAFMSCLLEFFVIPSVEGYDWNYLKEYIQHEMQWFLYGSYLEVVYYRLWLLPTRVYSEWWSNFPLCVGMMLFGMACWKAGVLTQMEKFRGLLTRVAIMGGLGGLVATVVSMRSRASLDYEPVDMVLRIVGTLAMAVAYGAGGLLCLARCKPGSFVARMGDLGKMTLTNYLAQSLVFTTIFYGYGFGRLGLVSSSMALVLGLAVFTLQLYWSEHWLRHHRFGPVEWLWRRLTYGKRGVEEAPQA